MHSFFASIQYVIKSTQRMKESKGNICKEYEPYGKIEKRKCFLLLTVGQMSWQLNEIHGTMSRTSFTMIVYTEISASRAVSSAMLQLGQMLNGLHSLYL